MIAVPLSFKYSRLIGRGLVGRIDQSQDACVYGSVLPPLPGLSDNFPATGSLSIIHDPTFRKE